MVADDPESFADLDGHISLPGQEGEGCSPGGGACTQRESQASANTAAQNQGPSATASVTTSSDGVQVNAKAAILDEKITDKKGVDSGNLQIGAASASAQASLKNANISADASLTGIGANIKQSGGPTAGTVNISAGDANANASISTKGVSAGAEATFMKFGSTLSAKIGGVTVTLSSEVTSLA